MGLDMYLNKRTFIGAEYEHRKITGTIEIKQEGKPIPIKFERVSIIEERVGYWRKANHIHQWFVTNVQGGEDDCKPYELELRHVKELLEACEAVKADNSKAEELLPTQGGFFFGGTEYDEWYFKDIDNTIEIMKTILEENGDKDYLTSDIVYQSSW